MRVIVMVLVGYGSIDNRLRLWPKADWMFFHSDRKNLYQRLLLLPAAHQFLESER